MNIQVILTVLLTLVLATGAPTIVAAQYYSENASAQDYSGMTLEEALEIQSARISFEGPRSQNDYTSIAFYPHHMLVIMVPVLLGGIAAIFFIKGRSDKYAAVGRG